MKLTTYSKRIVVKLTKMINNPLFDVVMAYIIILGIMYLISKA